MLLIEKQVVTDFTNYFKSLLPNEACGLLVTHNDSMNFVINEFVSITNLSNQPDKHFYFSPKDFIKQLYEVEAKNGKIVGIIHSHPTTDSKPSSEDIANWYYPELSYWIYSIKKSTLQAFYIRNQVVSSAEYTIL